MYKLLRSLLFCFDAEKVHYFSMRSFSYLLKIPGTRAVLKKYFQAAYVNSFKLNNVVFNNIVGLAAGFDKNGTYLNELEILGFGFIEVGTITPLPQPGNEKPRLFRLPKDNAIINRMGFNNDGADAVASRLQQWRKTPSGMIIGANIGKNKQTPNNDAWKDYETCFLKLHKYVDYIAINISSPNTPGLRDLQGKESLEKILVPLIQHNDHLHSPLPLFVKLSPDLDYETADELVKVCIDLKITGLIIANTTITRNNLETEKIKIDAIGNGGLSGKPLSEISMHLLAHIHNTIKGKLILIASGGIFTTEDVKRRLEAGASLVQVYTGFIYEGPAIVKKILNDLTA